MNAVGHIAVMTADLDRFRAFYDEVLGIRASIVMRMDDGPGYRHAFFPVDDRTLLHVFEVPGFDPAADGYSSDIGRRGRLDHFGFLLGSREEFEAARHRLVAAGASDGSITDFGPLLNVYFEDPDGMPCEITMVAEGYDPAEVPGDQILEVPDPHWFDQIRNSVASLTSA
jgi:catechol 2,3-dioxygenase-like lactoylglutathione lyase family enzyme